MARTHVDVVRIPPGRQPRRGVDPMLEQLGRLMDAQFEIPGLGVRFGLDALIGLIPGVGDTVSGLVGLYIISAASKHGVPRITLARMAGNLVIDFVVGSIPIVGDLFDVAWKSNQRNVELLKRAVSSSPEDARRTRRGDWLFVGGLLLLLVLLLAGSIALGWLVIAALVRLASGG